MSSSPLRSLALTAVFSIFALAACAKLDVASEDPFVDGGPALAMVPANHTDRYTVGVYVDKYWAGGVYPQSGGTASVCCFPGMKDWSKPVTVTWEWGTEEDPVTTRQRPCLVKSIAFRSTFPLAAHTTISTGTIRMPICVSSFETEILQH